MSEEKLLSPDYLFEVSWEVCNKVGGIYTVIATKSATLVEELGENYITIGPDVWKGNENADFVEDYDLFASWKEQAQQEGLRIKTGRWKNASNAIAILVDFTPLYTKKDEIFTHLWMQYHVDSLTGQWDYIEPALFGYCAGKVIESFYRFHLSYNDKIVAHFHEWMTGAGALYLHEFAPQIGTVFTTHATVLGRSIAGNGLPLYDKLSQYNADQMARQFNVVAKQSLEKRTAQYADCFTTVSEITAQECKQFLEEEPDLITPNGFDIRIVPDENLFEEKRKQAREKLLQVAKALTGDDLPENTLLIAKSGRYEFRNKGIDVFLDALARLKQSNALHQKTVAFIMVPAHHTGPRKEVLDRMQNLSALNTFTPELLTHHLQGADSDPIMKKIYACKLTNNRQDPVKVIFAPTYLNGDDGIFNLHYYDLFIGFDISAFPSYYEPWGYTPLESLAFRIPTITTQLTGFGKWIKTHFSNAYKGIYIVERHDYNDEQTSEQIATIIRDFSRKSPGEVAEERFHAHELSKKVQWNNLITYYKKAFDIALQKSLGREYLFKEKHEITPIGDERHLRHIKNNQPKWRKILVKTEIPESLSPLVELSKNLWWSWNQEAAELFEMIDPQLWEEYHKNPVALLDVLPYAKLKRLEKNAAFQEKLHAVYSAFRSYMDQPKTRQPRVAYFCMEYGLNAIIRLYSGGLGILAGDFLKEASDTGLDMVGVGLLYRYGYFKQELSPHGEQLAVYKSQKFSFLPVLPVRDEEGNWKKISVSLPGRKVYAKIWQIQVGRVPLYLLDTDIEDNQPDDRTITHQLYGGDIEYRLKQEILLGIGGERLLRSMGIKADIYHCNEGHAAFVGLERIKNLVLEENISFDEALEIVRSTSLFTTHTPVPAGHDAFSEDLIRAYLSEYPNVFNIPWERFIGLGRIDETNAAEKFSMSYLAARLCGEINGVSRLHGQVSREMFQPLYPGFITSELPIGHITNGVHYSTWTDKAWQALHREVFGTDAYQLPPPDPQQWKKLQHAEAKRIWNIRKLLKSRLLKALTDKLRSEMSQRHENPKGILDILHAFNEETLIIGFARRFATYKRAHLLFHNLERLRHLVNLPQLPVQFLFAGKAHPKDKAGQDLIKRIIEVSQMPDFKGKIIFLQNYDMELATLLVQGVDLWLNNPERLMEASGTSGMKASLNGVLNLSVMDGWWAEGYKPGAGWALPLENTYNRKDYQDELDSETLYSILEKDVIPTFFDRNAHGIPERWIESIKLNLTDIAPYFTTRRMLDEYINTFYEPMYEYFREIKQNDFSAVKELCAWKNKILANWPYIKIMDMDIHDSANKALTLGEEYYAQITLNLGNLSPEEIGMEVLFIQSKNHGKPREIIFKQEMTVTQKNRSRATYATRFPVTQSGVFEYGFRIYPKHPLLKKKTDFNLIKWL
ncbi:MAG: hypothetical protein KatS3mg031_2658 [Chitinophagales bacterium]|nr:MAG: hypothetical protein KatS3mg031_2658 [Chitinophagales bacterium]